MVFEEGAGGECPEVIWKFLSREGVAKSESLTASEC